MILFGVTEYGHNLVLDMHLNAYILPGYIDFLSKSYTKSKK